MAAEIEANALQLERLESISARMVQVLDTGDAEGLRQLADEAQRLGVALGDVGQRTAFAQVASEIELVQARLARLRNESDVTTRSIASLESAFGETAIDILGSLVERRREVTSTFLEAEERARELERQIDAFDYNPRNPDRYAAAVLKISDELERARTEAQKAETGLESINRQLGTTTLKVEKTGNTLEIFTRNRLADAARASIDKLFQTGQLERAEEILRRFPKDVLASVFPGETVDEILDWQRQIQKAYEDLTEEAEKSQRAQAEASKELLRSLEKLRSSTDEQQALRLARDLDQAYSDFWNRFIDFQGVVVSNEDELSAALQAGLDPLRFMTGEYSAQVELLVRQLALETAINERTSELLSKKAELVERQRELVRAQEEFERNLLEETQIAAEQRVLGSIPDNSDELMRQAADAFLPSPEEMRQRGAELVNDFREQWADGIEAMQGLWRTALSSILEDGTISFESLGQVITDTFESVFARMVDQAVESIFIVQAQAQATETAGSSASMAGGAGSSASLFAGAAGAVLGVAAIAYIAYEIADSLIDRRRDKTLSHPITIGFSSDRGFHGQAIGGNIGDATGLDFVQIQASIRNQFQDLRIAIGGFLEFLPEMSIQVRRDGDQFKLTVGGVLISSFETMEEAVRTGIEFALKDAEFSGIGRNMQGLLDRLASIGLENADPFLELARTLDRLGLDEVTIAFQDLNTLFSVYADRVREMGGSEADLMRWRNEALCELGEQVRDTLGQFVEGFDSLKRVHQLLNALKNAQAFNEGLAGEAAFRDDFLDRVDRTTPGPRVGGGRPGAGDPGRHHGGTGGPNGVLIQMAATFDAASTQAAGAIQRTVGAFGELEVGVMALPGSTQVALAEEQRLRDVAGAQLAQSASSSGRTLEDLSQQLVNVRKPAETTSKSMIDLESALGDVAPPLTRLPDELRDAAEDIPPAIDAAFAQLAIDNEAARLQASLSSGLADFLGSEEQRREAERLTHQLKLAQMRMELEALRILAQETGAVTQDMIDPYDRLLTDAEQRLASGQLPRRRRRQRGLGDEDQEQARREEIRKMLAELHAGLAETAAEIARTRSETDKLIEEMRELGFEEADVAEMLAHRRDAEAARAREAQFDFEVELARLAGDQERIALLEREAALARIDAIEQEMEGLHQLGLISDQALADARAAAEAARQNVNDTFEAENGLQAQRRAFLDDLGRILPSIADLQAAKELREFLRELPQHAEELGFASERLRRQVSRGLELNFFDALGRFSGFDNDRARKREESLRDQQALFNLRLQLSLLEEFGNLTDAQIEEYRGYVAEVEEGLSRGDTVVVDRDRIRQELSAFIPSLAEVLELERTVAFFDQLNRQMRDLGHTEEEILAARQEASESLYVSLLERLARATGNEEALRAAAEIRHLMEVASYRLRLHLLEQEGILTQTQAATVRGLIDEFERMGPQLPGTPPETDPNTPRYRVQDNRSARQRQIDELNQLRDQLESILSSWRAVPLDDVTREAQALLDQRAQLDDILERLGVRSGLPSNAEIEEAFAQARSGFLDNVLGDVSELDPLSRELQEIYDHFRSVRSALEDLGGTTAEFGRVAEAEARRLEAFEERLFSPIEAELDALQGVGRTEPENRRGLVEDLRVAVQRFQSGDLTAAADAVELSRQLRSQIDQLQVPGERRALLTFLESQLSGLWEAGIPDFQDAQERLADVAGLQLTAQERIAGLLEEQVQLMTEGSAYPPSLAAPSIATPIRIEVTPPADRAAQVAMERRLDKVSSELAKVSKKLDKLVPIGATLNTANAQRKEMLRELQKSKGVKT